jgi:hypothetical protein
MARLLGFMGLIPFLAGGVGVWLEALGDLRFALPILGLAYGALIASFLGGVRWGAAMQNNRADSQPRHLVMAIVPSLIALVAFLLPLPQAFGLLIILFTAQAVLDVTASDNGDVMAWYKPLRIWLSVIACAAMASLLVHTLTH